MKNFLENKGFLMPFIYGYKTMKNNPYYFVIDTLSDIKKDNDWKKRYNKGDNLICFGLPKSGSTMIEQIFRELGYIDVFNTSIRKYKKLPIHKHPHEIHEGFFKYLPKYKGNFLKTHSHFKSEYLDLLKLFNFSAFILIRDIRDMMLSRYYHIINDPFHSENKKIKELSFNEGFTVSLLTIKSGDKFSQLQYFNNWIVDWIKLNKFPIIKFEEFNQNKLNFLKQIISFSLIQNLNESKILEIIKKLSVLRRENEPMKKKLKYFGKKKTTFRKGVTGNWRNNFSDDHKKLFKKIAQESLEIAGYEKNLDW